MDMQTSILDKDLKSSTIDLLKELSQALNNSSQQLTEATRQVKDDPVVSETLKSICSDRDKTYQWLTGLLIEHDESPVTDGTLTGKLRVIWTAMRASLNSGDPLIVLIEAEKAENALLEHFQSILGEIAHVPLSVGLNQHYETVKRGRDRLALLRNRYECEISV